MTNAQPTEATDAPVEEKPAEEAPAEDQAAAAPETMESLMAKHEAYEESFKQLKRGEVLTGRVIQISDDGVMVDVGYKTEGVIPLSQLSHQRDIDPHTVVSVGDEVKVVVKKIDDAEGTVVLSKKTG